MFFCCSNPSSWVAVVAIAIASFGIYGLLTVGYVMVAKSCSNEMRGSVMGINCLFGAVGILIVAKIGGVMFDNVSVLSPFIIVCACNFLMLIPLSIPSIRKELDS
jgi:predicted MFS family arabinose efflux permease